MCIDLPLLLILNDTSNYHCGSAQVIKFLKTDAQNAGFQTKTFKLGTMPPEEDLQKCAAVLVNGEGSMHHNSKNGLKFLGVLKEAQKAGKRTALVNSVWCSITRGDPADVLNKLDVLSVREVVSANELFRQFVRNVSVNLDVAYFSEVRVAGGDRSNVCIGNFFQHRESFSFKGSSEYARTSIMDKSWRKLQEDIARSQLLITGRHHEFIAACISRTPCVLLSGNTHKIEGILQTAGAQVPVLPSQASDDDIERMVSRTLEGEFDEGWKKLWKYTDNHPTPSFASALISST